MEAFPFTEAEWQAVRDAAHFVVNAAMGEDPEVEASHLIELLDVLGNLRKCHGEHPILLETAADFAEEDDERLLLYQQAARVAAANGLSTLSIRLSLAELLVDLDQMGAARDELLACESELLTGAESDRIRWHELLAISKANHESTKIENAK